jgi:serine/threonine protein kinase/predicted ATPase/class 3 adenylate cyclase
MNPDRWKKIDQLLDLLLELEPGKRPAFLDAVCANDSELRRELESLLSAHAQPDGFIDTIRADAAAELFGNLSTDLLGKTLSHYQVMSSLGAGGMGEVYLARDTSLGRPVALKLLAAQFTRDSDRVKRFQQEASAASALNHPGILTVYEIGQHDDLHFIATEYVEGETLRQRIKNGPVKLIDALDAAIQMAGALAAAHAAGIVHRDIKPENIMIRPDGLVKVLDFGVAKLIQNSPSSTTLRTAVDRIRTETGAILGTIQYMSPEQLRALELDQRTDIFSLGIVLYELVSGTRPFTGDTPTDEMVSLLEKEPLPLKGPTELERIVKKALAKDRSRRYQTATELQTDLKAFMRNAELELQQSLSCPLCSRQSSGAFEFCGNCGAALKKKCPNCDGHVAATSDFCGLCGFKFQSAKETSAYRAQSGSFSSGLGDERRRATIVYSVISGCSAILERFDPEEADRDLQSIRQTVVSVITEHGGVVERCNGEEVVALFGVPASYEDDFLRAVRAALDLRLRLRNLSADLEMRLGQPLRIYTGISSGSVVARVSDEKQFNVTGEALQTATRLAANAEADEILVSPETQRLIQPFFRLSSKGSIPLKPSAEAVPVFRVEGETGIQTRLEAAEVMGLTAYVGRTDELGVLQSSLSRALSGEGQFVTVLGEAGLGKSRLLLEFLSSLEGTPVNIVQSRCHSHGSTTPYLPFIDSLRDLLSLRKEEAPERIRETAIANIKSIDPSLEAYIPVYLHLLSIESIDHSGTGDLKGDDLSLAIQEALSAILTLHSRSAPGVILLEDWHWADEASVETLKRVASLLPVHPLLIVTTSRPEGSLDWTYVENHTLLSLTPLSESYSVQIIESIVGSKKLPDGFGDLLYRRTGGNPFFVEEVCRTLVDNGTIKVIDGSARLEGSLEDLNIPDTVQSLIRTRLDQLDAESQALLRRAAVLGREFNLRVLDRMTERQSAITSCLEGLQKKGLIQQIRVVPESVYRFKHVLTQEVAYDSLLFHQRKALHESAGRALEELYNGRFEEQLEVLTFHYSRAENWPKAVRFGRESAAKASRLSRFAEALAMLERTEEWSAKLDKTSECERTTIEILLAQERQCETLGLRDRQQTLIDRVFSLLSNSGDEDLLAETLVRQGELCTLLESFEKAEAAFNEALVIRRTRADSLGERIVLRNMGFLHWRQGRYEDAVSCNKTALSIDLSHDDTEGYAKDLTNLASILRSQGKPREALEYVEEALKVNQVIRPFSQGYVFTVAANVYRDLGEPERAKKHYQRAVEVAKQHCLPLHQIITESALASLCWERGEYEDAVRQSTELVALTRRLNLKRELGQALGVFSQRLLELDRLDEALPPLCEAAEIYLQLGDTEERIRALTSIAYVYERCGQNPDATLKAWENVQSLSASQGNVSGTLEAFEGLARVARNQKRDLAAALSYLDRALQVAEEIGDGAKKGDLLNTMGIIEWGRSNYTEALDYYQRALAFFESLGDAVHAGLMLNSIGVTLHNLGRAEESVAHLGNALQLHRQSGQRLLEAHALAALGKISDEAMSLDEAREYYAASLQIRKEIGDRTGEGWMSHHLARILFSQGGKAQALPLLNSATAIAAETGDTQLGDACTRLQM